jgi:hypothetical protein
VSAPRLNPDGLDVFIPRDPADEACEALGKEVARQVFRPLANGKLPVREYLGHERVRFSLWAAWMARLERHTHMVEDYHGGW